MLALAATGADEGLWLRAARQTAGKGRMGRDWKSETGNLFVSTIIRLRPGDPPAPSLAMLAAVALIEVLKGRAPLLPFAIKWPNDILCEGQKLAGILLERQENAVVVGMGVNLASHPEDLDRPVTNLLALGGETTDPAIMVHELATHFTYWLGRWRSEGLDPVLASWRRFAHLPGTKVTVNLPDFTSLSGDYEDLAADGALLLRLADGSVRAIHAGDVFLV